MTYRVAVVGCGGWARRHHIPALVADPRAEVVAVVDPDPVAIAAARALAPEASSWSDIRACLEGGEIDAAVIATYSASHSEVAVQCLERGVALLIEKPLTTRMEEALAILDAATTRNIPVVVGYTAQFSDAARAVKRWIRDDIGDLVQIVAEFSSRTERLFGGKGNLGYSVAAGGGQAHTQLTHVLGMIAWATELEFERVAGMADNRSLEVDVVDAGIFALSGGVSVVAGSAGTTGDDVPMRHRIRYLGSSGTVTQDLLFSWARLERAGGEQRVHPSHNDVPYPASAPVTSFLDVLDGGGADDGWRRDLRAACSAVAATQAFVESARSGRFVRVPRIPPAPLPGIQSGENHAPR